MDEARQLAGAAAAAAERGIFAMVGFNYRRVPAVALAQRLVEQGRIGTLRHVRAVYLQDWLVNPSAPLTWRLDNTEAGSGALGDILAHVVDLVRFVTGREITDVASLMETFVRERPLAAPGVGLDVAAAGSGAVGAVTVDDACAVVARLEGGVMATAEGRGTESFSPARRFKPAPARWFF